MQEQPQVTATVSPAPPPKSRWDAIPHHLGRARTSTVVLSVLFLAIGALWLNVRPDPDVPPPAPAGTEQPTMPPSAPAVPPVVPTDDPAPTTSAEPEPTSAAPTTTTTEPEGTTPTEPGTRLPTPTSGTPAPAPSPTGTTPTG
jgi:hypothetical protein